MAVRIYKIIPGFAVVLVSFVLALVLLDDFDVWWHLKCGELFLKEFWIPREEIFSYTATGSRWVDGYLPAQALLYIAWWVAGPSGLCFLGAALVAGTYALALVMSRRGAGFSIALAASIPAVFLSRSVMLPRPALLTPIFALLCLWLLEDNRRNGGRRIWWMIPLTALWANCHPGFLLGPIFTAMYLAGNLLSILTRADRRPLTLMSALILPAQLLATLINPYGHRIYYSTLSLITHSQLTQVIQEWKPLFGEPKEVSGSVECFLGMVVLWLASLVWSGRRGRPEHAIIFVFIALATASMRRNLLLFGSVSLPLLSWTFYEGTIRRLQRRNSFAGTGDHPSYRQTDAYPWHLALIVRVGSALDKGLKPLVILLALFFIWFAATDRLYFYSGHFRSTGLGIQHAMFAEGAVDFLQRERVKGRLFHTYSQGGYLIFRLYPKYRVYIDGRIYPYPFELFETGELALRSNDAFERIRSMYDIRAVLLPLFPQKTWPMIMGLLKAPNWAAVYADGTAVLFLERGAGNDSVINKYEVDPLSDPPPLPSPPASRSGLFDKTQYPCEHIRWAKLYERYNRHDLAARALRPALEYRPLVKYIDAWLGDLLIQAGQLEEGIGYITQVLKQMPNNTVALCGLADYHIAKQDYEKAQEILIRLTRLQPELYKAWKTLGEIAYNAHDFGEAARRFRIAVELEPGDARTWENLGMSLEFFDVPEAKAAYERSLELIKKSGGSTDDIKRIMDHLRRLRDE